MAIKFLSDTTHEKGDIHLDGTSSERLDLDSGVKITGQYNANGGTEYTYINMYNGGDASINIGTKHNLGYISFESGNGAYTERMRITNNGNVGIGTTSPGRPLTVHSSDNTRIEIKETTENITSHWGVNAGAMFLTTETNHPINLYTNSTKRISIDSSALTLTTTASNQSIVYWGTNTAYGIRGGGNYGYMGYNTGGYHRFMYAGAEQMRITSDGKVGIGTTSPAVRLDFGNSVNQAFHLYTSGVDYYGINMTQYDSGPYSTNIISGNGGQIKFRTASGTSTQTTRMTVTQTGNVGIGTTSPGASLHVASTTSDFVAKFSHTTATGYAPGSILLQAGQGTSRGQGLFHYNTEADESWFTGVPYNVASRKWIVANKPSTTFNPDVAQLSHALFTIEDDGNVGIGTTSPSHKLQVAGNIYANAGQIYIDNGYYLSGGDATSRVYLGNDGSQGVQIYTDSTERMRIADGGNVGIGTSSPGAPLDVNGRIISRNDVYISSAFPRIWLNDTNNNSDYSIINGNGTLRIYDDTNSADRFAITSAGNVGIGTTSPSAKLHVAGAIKTTGDVTMSSNTTLHIGNVDLTTGSGGNTVSVEAASSSNTAMNFKTSGGTTAVFMVYQGTTTTRFAGRVEPSGNRTLDLGTDALRWQVVYCETLDSAGQHESNLQNPEGEKSVGDYATGTVLVWKGGKNIPCTEAADHMRMGIAVNGTKSPLVQGAEPVLVSGTVSEGDYLVTSSIEGHAKAISPQFMRQHGLYDCVIGKALESGEGKSYLIKTWINI